MLEKRPSLTAVLLSLVLLAGCTAPPPESGDGAAESGESGDAATGSEARIAPDFTLPRIGGGEVSLADSAGAIRLVDFWATWCAPCREEIPMLNELQRTYGDRGFQILAISSESEGVIEEFLVDHPVEYTNLIGTEDLEQEYGAVGLPTGFLIDGEGRVAEVYFGAKPRKVLEKKIEELLAAS